MTPQRWPIYRQVQRHAELLDRMLAMLDIDLVTAVRQERGRALAEARTACLHCHNADACEAWLDASDRAWQPPSFCRIAPFLHHLAHEGRREGRA